MSGHANELINSTVKSSLYVSHVNTGIGQNFGTGKPLIIMQESVVFYLLHRGDVCGVLHTGVNGYTGTK